MRNKSDCLSRLQTAGFNYEDACALRRISMTLHRWHELECNGDIERGEATGKPYAAWSDHNGHRRQSDAPVPDRERGALKRLQAIMVRYPEFASYVQGDPRGCALYIMTPYHLNDSPHPAPANRRSPEFREWLSANYSRGIGVYK